MMRPLKSEENDSKFIAQASDVHPEVEGDEIDNYLRKLRSLDFYRSMSEYEALSLFRFEYTERPVEVLIDWLLSDNQLKFEAARQVLIQFIYRQHSPLGKLAVINFFIINLPEQAERKTFVQHLDLDSISEKIRLELSSYVKKIVNVVSPGTSKEPDEYLQVVKDLMGLKNPLKKAAYLECLNVAMNFDDFVHSFRKIYDDFYNDGEFDRDSNDIAKYLESTQDYLKTAFLKLQNSEEFSPLKNVQFDLKYPNCFSKIHVSQDEKTKIFRELKKALPGLLAVDRN